MSSKVCVANGGPEELSERQGRKFDNPLATKTQLEREIEKTISDLLVGKETSEPIRMGRKIIKTLDEETKIEYEIVVNQRTGQQEIVEHILSDKKQCSMCRANVSKSSIYRCELCGKQVCGLHYGSLQVIDGYKNVPYRDYYDKGFLADYSVKTREDPIYKNVNVCSTCYSARTDKDFESEDGKNQNERLERLGRNFG
jgi:ribosomal protein L37AE/L43A